MRLLLWWVYRLPDALEGLCKYEGASEDHDGADPVLNSEGVLEVPDAEDEAGELAQGDD